MDDIQKVKLEYEDFFPLLNNQVISCPDNRERFLFTKQSQNTPMCCHAPDYFDKSSLSLNKVQLLRIIATFCSVVSKYCLKLFLALESFNLHLYFVSFDTSSRFWLSQIQSLNSNCSDIFKPELSFHFLEWSPGIMKINAFVL